MINTLIKNRKGFTLIELIVTIALLAVISTISVVSVNYVIVESKVSDCENLFKNIEIASKNYVSDNRYSDINKKENIVITAEDLINGEYLSSPLVNPFTGNEIHPRKIKVLVGLKDDYSVDSVQIMTHSQTKLECDDKSLSDLETTTDDEEIVDSENLLQVAIPTAKEYCVPSVYTGTTVVFVTKTSEYFTLKNTSGLDPGTYTVTASLVSDNYIWVDETTTPKTFDCNIDKKSLKIVAEDQVYGKVDSDIEQITSDGLIDNHRITDIKVEADTDNGIINVSDAKITHGTIDVTKKYQILYVPGNIINEDFTGGAVTISGSLVYGETLKANVTHTNPAGTYTYQWYTNTTASNTGGTALSGETNQTLNLKPVTFDKYIYVVVTAKKDYYNDKKITSAISSTKVSARDITITANSNSKTYDGTALTDNVCTLTSGSFVFDDYLSGCVMTSESKIINVGSVDNVIDIVSLKDKSDTDVNRYYNVIKENGKLVIDKASGSISYGTTSISKTYGDASFTNTLTNTGDGTVTYSSSNTSVATVNSSTGTVTIVGAGSTTITATVTDGTNYTYQTKTATYTLNVAKKGNSVTINCASLTYTGSAQTLISSGSASSGSIYYKVGTELISSNYDTAGSTTKPTGTNAEDYTIYYYVPSSDNYNEASGSKTCSITKVDGSISYGTTSVSKTYGDSSFTNLLTKTGDGSLAYTSSDTNVATVNSSTGEVTVVNAGSTTITATVTDGTNYTYETKTATYTLNVAKKDNTLSVTAVGGVYSGTSLPLVSVSNAQGDVYYNVGTQLTSSNYDTIGNSAIPKNICSDSQTGYSNGKNIYTVYYYTPGNTNYNSKSGSITATVTCKTYTISYNANGGSGAPAAQTKYFGIPLNLSETEPTREYYTFMGWALNPDDTTSNVNNPYSVDSDKTLYAVWQKNETKLCDVFVKAKTGTYESDGCPSASCDNLGEICENGTDMLINVGGDEKYWFTTISDTGSKITLLLKQDIGSTAWNSSTYNVSDGPITLVNALDELTKGWTNLYPKKYIIQDDESSRYEPIEEARRARILTYNEVYATGCRNHELDTCPRYIVDYFVYNDDVDCDGDIKYGYSGLPLYWLSSSLFTDSSNTYIVRHMNPGARFIEASEIETESVINNPVLNAIRPVIELEKCE